MTDVVNALNNISGALQPSIFDWMQVLSAIGTLIAAIVAVIAAFQSYRSAKENRLTSEQMIRPRVIVYIRGTEASSNFIEIVVRNDGGGVARDITFRVKRDDLRLTHQEPGRNLLSQLRVFQSGIKVLPTGSEKEYFILSLIGRYEELIKAETVVNISYRDNLSGKMYEDSFALDFASLPESGWTSDDMRALKNIEKELKGIKNAITKNTKLLSG